MSKSVYESSCMFILNRGSPDTRVRPKKYLWFRFPNQPYFFLPTLLFFDAAKHAALFYPGTWLWAAHTVERAKMASVVTIVIELCTHNMNNMTREKAFCISASQQNCD